MQSMVGSSSQLNCLIDTYGETVRNSCRTARNSTQLLLPPSLPRLPAFFFAKRTEDDLGRNRNRHTQAHTNGFFRRRLLSLTKLKHGVVRTANFTKLCALVVSFAGRLYHLPEIENCTNTSQEQLVDANVEWRVIIRSLSPDTPLHQQHTALHRALVSRTVFQKQRLTDVMGWVRASRASCGRTATVQWLIDTETRRSALRWFVRAGFSSFHRGALSSAALR